MQKLSQIYFGASKINLRYLKNTKEFGIWYKTTINSKLLGYTNNDWARSIDDMKSKSIYVFSFEREYSPGHQRNKQLFHNQLQRQTVWQ